jgi:hypothetical protein
MSAGPGPGIEGFDYSRGDTFDYNTFFGTPDFLFSGDGFFARLGMSAEQYDAIPAVHEFKRLITEMAVPNRHQGRNARDLYRQDILKLAFHSAKMAHGGLPLSPELSQAMVNILGAEQRKETVASYAGWGEVQHMQDVEDLLAQGFSQEEATRLADLKAKRNSSKNFKRGGDGGSSVGNKKKRNTKPSKKKKTDKGKADQ